MEKDKSRGIKHIKDKRKYKGNSIKNPKYVPPKSKPNLESNWDRYEVTEENAEEHKLNSSTDFAMLSNVPISSGSYFQFKSDKLKEDDGQEDENELFCLNLDMLHRSISTIPFYKRLGIATEYFKESQIKQMDEKAARKLTFYENYLAKKNSHIQKNVDFNAESVSSASPPVHIATKTGGEMVNPNDKITGGSENVNSLLELIEDCPDTKEHQDSQANVTPKEDLEQWLDDILED